MKSTIFVPKTIKVGYQNRSDTYTKKLAYIVYYDEKGKLRKETSWSSWRDEKIEPNDFDNVPTTGFVLNKKVGDYDSGWNHRHAYVRIYDPRNFEFEITIENLLYILENTSSIKGKGLEGEFVYGWDGKDLILIPTGSPDFKEINSYNDILHNNELIKAKDLVIGATYITKDNNEMIYIGKHDYYSSGYKWFENGEYKTSKRNSDIPTERSRWGGDSTIDYKYISNFHYGKYFWFAYKYHNYDYINGERVYRLEFEWKFEQYSSVSGKFIKCINNSCVDVYQDILNSLEESHEYSPYDESKDTYVNLSLEDYIKQGKTKRSNGGYYYSSFKFISDVGGKKTTYMADPKGDEGKYILKKYTRNKNSYSIGYSVSYDEELSIFPVEKVISSYGYNRESKRMIPITLEEMYNVMKPMCKQCYLKNGKEYKKEFQYE